MAYIKRVASLSGRAPYLEWSADGTIPATPVQACVFKNNLYVLCTNWKVYSNASGSWVEVLNLGVTYTHPNPPPTYNSFGPIMYSFSGYIFFIEAINNFLGGAWRTAIIRKWDGTTLTDDINVTSYQFDSGANVCFFVYNNKLYNALCQNSYAICGMKRNADGSWTSGVIANPSSFLKVSEVFDGALQTDSSPYNGIMTDDGDETFTYTHDLVTDSVYQYGIHGGRIYAPHAAAGLKYRTTYNGAWSSQSLMSGYDTPKNCIGLDKLYLLSRKTSNAKYSITSFDGSTWALEVEMTTANQFVMFVASRTTLWAIDGTTVYKKQ